jgi:ABC-type transporter Mla subunit MlaD
LSAEPGPDRRRDDPHRHRRRVHLVPGEQTGLPFVPTYQIKAEMPNGAKLVKGNEVRAGGFRVGIVKDITSERKTVARQGARDRRARISSWTRRSQPLSRRLDPVGAATAPRSA